MTSEVESSHRLFYTLELECAKKEHDLQVKSFTILAFDAHFVDDSSREVRLPAFNVLFMKWLVILRGFPRAAGRAMGWTLPDEL